MTPKSQARALAQNNKAGRGPLLSGIYHKNITKDAARTHQLFEAKIKADLERCGIMRLTTQETI